MKRKTIAIIFIIILLVGACAALRIAVRPSLKGYQSEFDFSLEGLKVKVEKYYHDKAFRDPCAVYAVRITGLKENTVFDPAIMDEGLSDTVRAVVSHANTAAANEGKETVIDIADENVCRSTVLKSSIENSREKLNIVYDPSEELYYVIWQSW
ncbi:MAG: hypothetical protein IKI73_01340 [Firmicutes bacterium]|nr:hypothetical protein [Bacillota bacterium]MBR6236806.1 hypothetical protein [Bacillota bacterium]